MDYNLIPKSDKWILKGNVCYIKHYVKIPILKVCDDYIWVFLDKRIHKSVIKLTKILSENGVEFYFRSPSIFFETDNKFIEDNINNYLMSFINPHFFDGFKKINFSLIDNLVSLLVKTEYSNELFNKIYDKSVKLVNMNFYDYHSMRTIWTYCSREDIRDDFLKIKRDIKISKLFFNI